MFETSIAAVAKVMPETGAIIALIGGTYQQQMEWANANLDMSKVTFLFVNRELDGAEIQVRGETLAGAVVLDKSYVVGTLMRAVSNALAGAAMLIGTPPATLIHHAWEKI